MFFISSLYALISKILTGVYVIYFVMIFFHLFIPPKIRSRRINARHSIRWQSYFFLVNSLIYMYNYYNHNRYLNAFMIFTPIKSLHRLFKYTQIFRLCVRLYVHVFNYISNCTWYLTFLVHYFKMKNIHCVQQI